MPDSSQIHHYTSIETLALILRNRKIRFNRLDRVDDVSEMKAYGKYDFSKYLFVSCWTECQKESIPQWNMYTNKMDGVRITLPKEMFRYRPFVAPVGKGVFVRDNIEYPFSFDEVYAENHFLMPNFFTKGNFGQRVKYVDDVTEIFSEDIKIELPAPGKATMSIDHMGEFASIKRKEWEFQQEYRFVLCALPSIPHAGRSFEEDGFVTEFSSFHIQSVFDGKKLDIDWIDVDLGESLSEAEITLGPLCGEPEKILVTALVDKYANKANIKQSELTGTIRLPSRD